MNESLEQQESARRAPRNVLIAIAFMVGIAGAAVILGTYLWDAHRPPAITAEMGRLTGIADDGQDMAIIDRSADTDVFFRVLLHNAPVGSELELFGKWIDPFGTIGRDNVYRTKKIDRSDWPTHIRCRIGPASQPGQWHVSLRTVERILAEKEFTVR